MKMNSIRHMSPVTVRKSCTSGNVKPEKLKLNEVYLDGRLKKAELIDDDEKSYGIFMHSLVLSNYAEVMKLNNSNTDIVGSDIEKAIYHYTASMGYNKKLIESIAPKVGEILIDDGDNLKISAHLINNQMRIVSKGTPDELLKRCSFILRDSKVTKITRRIFGELTIVLSDMLDRCAEVYAVAIKDIAGVDTSFDAGSNTDEMTLVAFVGFGSIGLQSGF